MGLAVEEKAAAIRDFQHHEKDTGSTEVQIALLTRKIAELSEHLAQHKKDHHSRRGLLTMVHQRRKYLTYLQKRQFSKYQQVIQALGLRK